MDYSLCMALCKALSYILEDIPVALVIYDIMCQYGIHLQSRVDKKSPELSISDSLELCTGIGLFHIHGHQDPCLPQFSPSYILGAKQVDREYHRLAKPMQVAGKGLLGIGTGSILEPVPNPYLWHGYPWVSEILT
jgi:hypothetical protein